jgi:Tfp pilus assembly protein PilN
MINLLPPDVKQDMQYGRRNITLVRWIVACFIAVLGVGALVGVGYIYLEKSAKDNLALAEAAKAELAAQKVDETQKKVEEISNNTKLATQVLSREILFSKLMKQLGASLPANTVLRELNIDKLQGGVSLRAGTRDIDGASQLQVNLQDPNNKIFEKADIENISCNEQDIYVCSVQIKALFSKNNPYLYISPTTEKKQ